MPLPMNNNVTRIEDLPELSDIENSFGKGGRGGEEVDVVGVSVVVVDGVDVSRERAGRRHHAHQGCAGRRADHLARQAVQRRGMEAATEEES